MEEFYTISQTAIALKVHQLTVRRYLKEGKLKAYRVGGNIRISVNDLRAFMQNFIPRRRQTRIQANLLDQSPTPKEFSFTDPFLSIKGKGLSMSKLELE